jgi:hypothetical protein
VALLAVVAVPAARPAAATGFRLSVVVQGERTLVRSTPAGIECGRRCSAVFPAGTIVRLTLVRVDSNFTYDRWGGACVGDLRTCLLVVDSSRIARVVLHRNRVDFGVSVGGPGRVRSSPPGIDCGAGHDRCEGTFGQGLPVALEASSGPTGAFATWGPPCGRATRCVVRVPAQGFATATFRHAYQFSVTKTGEGDLTCQPACGGTLASDQVVTVTATERTGSHFDGWSGACTGARPVCTFVDDARSSALATFTAGDAPTQAAVPVVVTTGGPGSVSGSGMDCGSTCTATVSAGSVVRLVARPTATSTFVGWTGDCSGAAACELTVDGPKAVGAVFRRLYPVAANGPEIGAPRTAKCVRPCKKLLPSDTVVTLIGPPPPIRVSWSGQCQGVGPRCRIVSDSAIDVVAAIAAAVKARAGLTGYGINVSVSGRGKVVSKDKKINCGYKASIVAGCHATFEPGSTIELRAVPAKGARFVGWQGFCTGTGVCRLKMTTTKTVYAIFSH